MSDYRVWCTSRGGKPEHGWVIDADDEAEAAEKWADRSDCEGDYLIVSGHEAIVSVRREGLSIGPVKSFRVIGESEPVYHAEELP